MFARATARLAPVSRLDSALIVSEYGIVFTSIGKRLARWPDKDGYEHVTYRWQDRVWNLPVHQLIAEAFIGPRPVGMTVNHINAIKRDNCISNLEYLSRTDNARHAAALGRRRGTSNANAKLTDGDVREMRRRYALGETQASLAQSFGITQVQVSHVVRRTRGGWPHIG